jgi:hypothetical protein
MMSQSISIQHPYCREALFDGGLGGLRLPGLDIGGDDKLGRLQHDISARHAGYHTVFLILLSP